MTDDVTGKGNENGDMWWKDTDRMHMMKVFVEVNGDDDDEPVVDDVLLVVRVVTMREEEVLVALTTA